MDESSRGLGSHNEGHGCKHVFFLGGGTLRAGLMIFIVCVCERERERERERDGAISTGLITPPLFIAGCLFAQLAVDQTEM